MSKITTLQGTVVECEVKVCNQKEEPSKATVETTLYGEVRNGPVARGRGLQPILT